MDGVVSREFLRFGGTVDSASLTLEFWKLLRKFQILYSCFLLVNFGKRLKLNNDRSLSSSLITSYPIIRS